MKTYMEWFNPIKGCTSWEEKCADYDKHQEIARSAFADMLHDEERNKKYYAAIKSAIDKKHQNGEKANVLDIGAGTGLLSMMAAKCGADSVIACEAFEPMAKCAEKIIQANGFEKIIKIIRKHSKDLTVGEDKDLPKRANILVAEVFDTELIGEGAISTFSHAQQVLLETNSIVVPSKGTLWIQVVESAKVKAWNKLSPILDEDNKTVLFKTYPGLDDCEGTSAVHDLQLSRIPRDSFTPLLPPLEIFNFDWSGQKPLYFQNRAVRHAKTIASGEPHAVFMWWDLQMDTDGENILSCAPVWEHPNVKLDIAKGKNMDVLAREIPWRDHWMQAIYYPTHVNSITMGDQIALLGYHNEFAFSFNMASDNLLEDLKFEMPVCSCYIHTAFSRSRIGLLNDDCRNKKYIEVLKQKVNSNSVCLCISDGSLLGIIAAKLGAKEVIIFEPNLLSRKAIEMFVDQNNISEKIQIINSLEEFPTEKKVDLVFGEPHFETSILPWDNLKFWYLVSKHFPGVEKFPISAKIRAVPMEFKDLHKIKQSVGICEGFDVSIYDRLVQDSREKSDSTVEAQPLWEYFGRALGPTFEIANFDLNQDVNLQNRVSVSSSTCFEVDGMCNGVAVWVDWKLSDEITISSGPQQEIQPGAPVIWDSYTKQGVHLFESSKRVTCMDVLSWSFNFVPQEGTMKFDFNFNEVLK